MACAVSAFAPFARVYGVGPSRVIAGCPPRSSFAARAVARSSPTFPLRPADLRVPGDALPAALQPYVLEIYEAPPSPGCGSVTLSATTETCLRVPLAGEAAGPKRSGAGQAARVVLVGPRPVATEVVSDRAGREFCVRFSPVGLYALFGLGGVPTDRRGLPAPRDARVSPEVPEVVQRYGDAVHALPAGLRPDEAFAARTSLTVAFLLHRAAQVTPETAFLQTVIDAIEQSCGNITVCDLARRLGIGQSTLRRRFGVLGMPVKQFAKIVRLRGAHAYRHMCPNATWAQTAYQFGYADQSHLIHDCRRLTGTTPARGQPDRLPTHRRWHAREGAHVAGLIGTP